MGGRAWTHEEIHEEIESAYQRGLNDGRREGIEEGALYSHLDQFCEKLHERPATEVIALAAKNALRKWPDLCLGQPPMAEGEGDHMTNSDDIEFLKELRENVVKGKTDISRHEMAIKMIDDWIDELAHKETT